jgi:hypothetical protein
MSDAAAEPQPAAPVVYHSPGFDNAGMYLAATPSDPGHT